MPVDPAEAEGAHAGAAWGCPTAVDPRSGQCVHVEGAILQDRSLRLLAVDARWQHFVVQGQRRLDQTGHARAWHAMPDHGLD